MVHGITTRDGRVLDGGTGLNRSTVVAALASLEARGLIIVVGGPADPGGGASNQY
jgi:DNA-binding MarR family transcriptional regulator